MDLSPFLEPNLKSAILVFLILVASWFWFRKSPNNLPPSPGIALPFIGHLYLIGSNPRKRFKEWNKRLGDIFSLQMGRSLVVVLNGPGLIREALVKQGDSFAARPVDDIINVQFPDRRKGIGFSSGAHWKAQRSTALMILKTLGMGTNILAEKISEELNFLVEEIRSTNERPTELKTVIYTSVANVICSIFFGKRFEYDSPKFKRLMNHLNTLVKLFNGITIINYFPFLRHIPFDPFKGKILLNTLYELDVFSNEMVVEVSLQSQEKNSDNFILAYLDEMKRQESTDQPTYLDTTSLARCIDDLFAAGTETTSGTLLWGILYSLHHPDIQEKVYQEIVEEIGTNRSPSVNDRPKLAYLNAYIMETQRLASLVPFSVVRLCTEDSTVGGHLIPKGTIIMPNLDSVHHSEKIWGDPHNFRPERFIDSHGKLKTTEDLIPFSVGKRVCLGEALARMELFLYMGNLFQKFKFSPADPQRLPPLTEVFGINAPPIQYEVKCVAR